MSIHFTCPSCNVRYAVTDDLAGKTAVCRECGRKLRVPPSPAPVHLPTAELITNEPAPVSAETSSATEYVPPLRRSGRSKQLAVLFVGAGLLVGVGLLVLLLIANRAQELERPTVAKTTLADRPVTKPSPDAPRTESVSDHSANDVLESVLWKLFVVVCIVLYLLPTLIGLVRNHHNLLAIFAMNLLLGWIFIGWAIAMIWACWNNKPAVHHHYHHRA